MKVCQRILDAVLTFMLRHVSIERRRMINQAVFNATTVRSVSSIAARGACWEARRGSK